MKSTLVYTLTKTASGSCLKWEWKFDLNFDCIEVSLGRKKNLQNFTLNLPIIELILWRCQFTISPLTSTLNDQSKIALKWFDSMIRDFKMLDFDFHTWSAHIAFHTPRKLKIIATLVESIIQVFYDGAIEKPNKYPIGTFSSEKKTLSVQSAENANRAYY